MDYWKDLTDQEFKMWEYIKFYNTNRKEFYIPAVEHLMLKLGKGRAATFNILASLRSKGLIN